METITDVPAFFAKRAKPTLSEHYTFVDSSAIAESLAKHGWEPREAFYRKPSTRAKSNENTDPLYKKHCVRYHNPSYKLRGKRGDRPEIIVDNSHDGSSAAIFRAGIFSMVCANGMTVAEETYDSFRLRHDNPTLRRYGAQFMDAVVDSVVSNVSDVMEVPQRWANIEVDAHHRLNFYKKAGELRDLEMHTHHYRQFDVPQRDDDIDHDLWTVFNRTQEYLVKGGLSKYTVKPNHIGDNVFDYRGRTMRPVREVRKLTQLNTELWGIALDLEKVMLN